MYAAAVEGLNAEEKADFDAGLSPVVASAPVVRALPTGQVDEVARARADRMAAIAALGGEVVMGRDG